MWKNYCQSKIIVYLIFLSCKNLAKLSRFEFTLQILGICRGKKHQKKSTIWEAIDSNSTNACQRVMNLSIFENFEKPLWWKFGIGSILSDVHILYRPWIVLFESFLFTNLKFIFYFPRVIKSFLEDANGWRLYEEVCSSNWCF